MRPDRKSTRLNSSHANISYAVFCLKKKNQIDRQSCNGCRCLFCTDAQPADDNVDAFFFFNDTATTEIYTLSLHDALPIYPELAKNFGAPLYPFFLDGVAGD